MESGTQGIGSRVDLVSSSISNLDRSTQQRLDNLIRLNEEIAREKNLYLSEYERRQAGLMRRPVTSRQAYSIYGGIIGSMPPASIAIKALLSDPGVTQGALMMVTLLLAASCLTGLIGFGLGRYVPSAIASVGRFRFPNRVAMTSLIGFFWGAISGGVGGLLFFIIGAIITAIVGGLVGAVTVPVFAALHNSVRYGDMVEAKHLLPIAFGIALSLCALIAGL